MAIQCWQADLVAAVIARSHLILQRSARVRPVEFPGLAPSSDVSRGTDARRARPILAICGDLHNVGDLALLLQNLEEAQRQGRVVLVRRWQALPPTIERQVAQAGGLLIDGRRVLSLLKEAWRSDLLIGGGQLVRQNVSLAALATLALYAFAARCGGGRIETRGLGISETQGLRRRIWRSILAGAHSLKLRDEVSLRRAHALCPGVPARVTADMALRGDLAARAAPAACEPAILVAVCEAPGEQRSAADPMLDKVLGLGRARWPGAPVVGLVHDLRPGEDRDRLRKLAQRDGAIEVRDEDGDLPRILALYRDARLVVTNRLHSGVFATLFARPLVVLDDGNEKLDVLSEQLSGERIGAWHMEAGKIPEIFDRAVLRAGDGADHRLDEARQKAEGNLIDFGRTAIFNVKFSPNLGDGIIAECLETGLRQAHRDIDPVSIDLAGRTEFDRGAGLRRRLLLRALETLPTPLRARLVPALLSLIVRRRLRPGWARVLASCDGAVIGGGALLADTDQNFPIKIANVLDLCARRQVPVAISHVGVTRGWSAAGRARLLAALGRVKLIGASVRDDESAKNLTAEFGSGLPPPQIALDPGLLCRDVYGVAQPREARSPRRRIGLSLTDPLVLRLHGAQPVAGRALKQWWQEVIEALQGLDCDVLLFTNGSPEDEQFVDEVFAGLPGNPSVSRMPRFLTPGDLARFIATLDCVVAHRLHACIAAYSYRIPAIGLAWDRKLRSFFELIGRERYVVDCEEHDAAQIRAMVNVAFDDPPDPAEHAAILARSRQGIAELAQSLVAARRGE